MSIIEINQLKIEVGDRILVEIPHLLVDKKARIGIIGQNGLGKTTLMEVIAGRQEAAAGMITTHGKLAYIKQLPTDTSTKSGGEKTRKAIQKAMRQNPSVLLADEPTSNLDVESVQHLERQWSDFHGALMIISHDRAFLDALCTEIWEIENQKIHVYKGNYHAYLEQKEQQANQAELAYKEFKNKKKQLQASQNYHEIEAGRIVKPGKRLNNKEASAFKAGKGTQQKKQHSTIKALEKRIERLGNVEKPHTTKPIKIITPENRLIKKGNTILSAKETTYKIAGHKLFETNAFSIKAGDKVALIGENASGKTSFLREIIQGTPNLATNPQAKIAYFDQELKGLDETKTLLENMTDMSVQTKQVNREVLGSMHFKESDLHKEVRMLSGGERVKLLLSMLLVSDANFLILDEPTNYLDIYAMEALETLIKQFTGTVLFVSHDRTFVKQVAEEVLAIENNQMTFHRMTYEEYEESETPSRISEEDKLILEMRMSEIAAKLMQPNLKPAEKAKLEQDYQEIITKRQQFS
ncbi:ABC-F type ribosomal protection protein [Listeria swaminathanii]|uniref:ABC-F type ribosomal protection protein n=1 Tax=Listeria swaminathanii TaxID=2713501 RepID=A0ABU2ICT5_9LIST|nr:ABC-F type ribosomal protection protein [Listeria swaminathanii]MDT0016208.1 ABC-F type ribosomal protection protein [Listeria swaminathanii]MDT0021644.1 ABC-F type ribosomal protection protein [Listeria swaminathanii]MDT0032608.1 ABC-F type ribosomal protection protein [Listeria swaminathanii]MDT0051542.1 ABC-F type ribosomal protection protein [Listeria swaminathanii]MDT0054307.1 ABC-F type ribosomal protection protein [Listeria swaminathanii]